jgi:hypothetical protein
MRTFVQACLFWGVIGAIVLVSTVRFAEELVRIYVLKQVARIPTG